MQFLFLILMLVRIAIVVGIFFFAKCGLKKLLPKTPRFLRISATILTFSILCASIDFLLGVNHSDPIMSFPVAFAGDGGSAIFVGPLYTVSRKVAYELGSGEETYLDYRVRFWFA